MKLNIVILTKDEPEAFRLIAHTCECCDPTDTVTVWDDFSEVGWVGVIRSLQAVYLFDFQQHRVNRNFSDHRNAVKDLLPAGEWILMLDADEWFESDFFDHMRRLPVIRPECDAFAPARCNGFYDPTNPTRPVFNPDTKLTCYPDHQPRMFKNIPAIHYENAIHEWLRGCTMGKLLGKDHTIYHHKPITWRNRYQEFDK